MTCWALNLSYQQSHLKNTWVLCNSKRLFQLKITKIFSVWTKRLSLFNLFCWEECIKVVCVCQVSLSFPSTTAKLKLFEPGIEWRGKYWKCDQNLTNIFILPSLYGIFCLWQLHFLTTLIWSKIIFDLATSLFTLSHWWTNNLTSMVLKS